MSKVISIVVPIYNVEKYIYKCIDSIINQTYTNLEIILVDDGSPDNCPKICDDYAVLDSRVKVIHKKNGGLSDARNAGLNTATGDYIIFIDGDDYAELNMIEKAHDTAQTSNCNVVIWGFFADYVDDDETLLKSEIHNHQSGVFRKAEYENIVFGKDLIGNLGYAWNKMYEIRYLKDYNFKFTKGLSLVEDIVFNSPVLCNSEIIAFLEEPLIHYMQRPRVTLGSKYYDDYFEIKMMGIGAVEKLLMSWNKDTKEISKIITTMRFGALKTTIRLLSVAENMKKPQKRKYLSETLNKPEVIETLTKVKPVTPRDKLICKLIKLKYSYLLLVTYSTFIKISRKGDGRNYFFK